MSLLDLARDLPLETLCPVCHGSGGDDSSYPEQRWRCGTCKGVGFVPTEFGKKIVELMRHNFKPMLQDVSTG